MEMLRWKIKRLLWKIEINKKTKIKIIGKIKTCERKGMEILIWKVEISIKMDMELRKVMEILIWKLEMLKWNRG